MDHSARGKLMLASFLTLVASGVGFANRTAVGGVWEREFGIGGSEFGMILGAGFLGFGAMIFFGGVLVEKLGYKVLLSAAFVGHLASAAMLFLANPLFEGWQVSDPENATQNVINLLYWSTFIYSICQGLYEAVINPMIAQLYPENQTHYLNILHAGWPGGLIVGGLASYFMNPDGAKAVSWQIQMSLFMVPVVLYGIMILGQKFPKSEAGEAGVSTGAMFAQLAAPLMIALLVIHAMVGYVELGTDSWIGKITGSIMASPQKGLLLFVYTSGLMFALRFFAGPIVHRISPLGLLCLSGILGFTGLQLLGAATSVTLCIIAATVYAAGKTFLWPTMLAVVSEQFPKGGAITIGAIGGVGMLSAGLLGGPGIGFKQDFNASNSLKEKAPAVYERYKAPEENSFLGYSVVGLDGAKVGVLDDGGKELNRAAELLKTSGATDENNATLMAWWSDASATAAEDKPEVTAATLHGGRMALKLTSYVPATMAVLYLLLILYFKARGGYKAVEVAESGGDDDLTPEAASIAEA